MFVFCLQELLVILFLVIVVTPLPPKIRIMTARAVTVLWSIKEPGGTLPVIIPTWTVSIITENTHHTLMVSTGITGKDITTPPRELRWKSDQWTFNNVLLYPPLLANQRKSVIGKEMFKWLINKNWKIGFVRLFIRLVFSLTSFSTLYSFLSFLFVLFFRFPSLVSYYLVLSFTWK